MSTSIRLFLGVAVWASLSSLAAQDCSVREIGTDESKTASFASGDCRLRDLIPGNRTDSYAHPYRVTLPRDGILTLDMKSANADTYLYFYSLSGVRLTANDNLSAVSTDSRIVIGLRQGTYMVIASTRGAATGAYTVQTAFGTRSTCPETEARLDAPMDGELTADTCRMIDLTAPSTDTSRVAAYRLTVASRSVLAAKVSSKAFSPYVEILDSAYESITYADAAGDPEVEMIVSLEPGSYVLLASTSAPGATGAYTLSAALAESQPCEPRKIGVGETVKGTLLYEESCAFLDLMFPSDDVTPVDLYQVTIEQRGVLSLSLSSTVFTPFVAIFDEQGNVLNSNADDEDPGPIAQITTSLAPGVYFLVANTYDDDGAYTLMSAFTDPRACNVEDARPGESMTGNLTAEGCRVLDLASPGANAAYGAGYRLPVTDRKVLTANQTSTQIDSALYLFDPASRLLSRDDNGGGGKNSRLITLLAPGSYLLAASAADGGTGSFTLNAQLADPPDCPVNSMEPAGTLSGELVSTDCRLRETVVGSTGGSYTKRYRVTLAEAGGLGLEVSSRVAPAVLVLTDAESKVIRVATTGLDGSARMTKSLSAGTYIVHVATLGSGQACPFTLRSKFEAGK